MNLCRSTRQKLNEDRSENDRKSIWIDTDWGSLSTHAGEPETERGLVRFRAENFLANGYSGRRLLALMRERGLARIRLKATALHLIDLTV